MTRAPMKQSKKSEQPTAFITFPGQINNGDIDWLNAEVAKRGGKISKQASVELQNELYRRHWERKFAIKSWSWPTFEEACKFFALVGLASLWLLIVALLLLVLRLLSQ